MQINDEVIIVNRRGRKIGKGILVKLSNKVTNNTLEYTCKGAYCPKHFFIGVEQKIKGFAGLDFVSSVTDIYSSILSHYSFNYYYYCVDEKTFNKYIKEVNYFNDIDILLTQIEEKWK